MAYIIPCDMDKLKTGYDSNLVFKMPELIFIGLHGALLVKFDF